MTLLDNASMDQRHYAIMRYCAKLENHHVIRHEADLGVWCSLNRGLAMSRGRWVMILTSDVLVGPNMLPRLLQAADRHGLGYFGPDWNHGLVSCFDLAAGSESEGTPDFSRYNGACWLMDWPKIRDGVGLYDPQFYVTFGDVDYIQRLSDKANETGDRSYAPCVVKGIPVVHLDKQTRRSEMTAEMDTDMEMRDGARFREKWADRPEVLALHPGLSREQYLVMKAKDMGGWKEARVI